VVVVVDALEKVVLLFFNWLGVVEENNEWQRILRAMSKSNEKDEMDFHFEASSGFNGLSAPAKRAVAMISDLPQSIEEGLAIRYAPLDHPS